MDSFTTLSDRHNQAYQEMLSVSNLSLISTLIERAVAADLNRYVHDHELGEPLQLAYLLFYSITVLKLIFYVLLLTPWTITSFYEVWNRFGIKWLVLNWLRSYLFERKQYVLIGQATSYAIGLIFGISLGSVLGTLLCVLYIFPLASIAHRHALMPMIHISI